jgi:hypothetical protein
MSRAVRWIRRWRVVERACGSRGCGVPCGVMTGFLWHRGGFPERYAWSIGRGRANLKHRKTVEQEHQLGRMQQGNTPTTAGWWNPGDGIRRPGRERQDTPIRVLHDVFEQISHPAYIAERKRVATLVPVATASIPAAKRGVQCPAHGAPIRRWGLHAPSQR